MEAWLLCVLVASRRSNRREYIVNRMKVLLVGASLVVVAFLLGLIPEFLKVRDLNMQLNSARQQLDVERQKLQSDKLDLLIGYIYLQTNVKNYGLASQYSTKFFDSVRVTVGQGTSDPSRKGFLESALARRDAVTSGLAKGDPGTAAAVQELFQTALETSGAEWK